MDKKTTGIIATVAAVLLCGCPGLVGFCLGAISVLASFVPESEIDIFGRNDPQSALTAGIVGICVGILFIAIPIVVGVLMLRKKPTKAIAFDEPLPPTA